MGVPVTDFARKHGWRRLKLDKERETTYLPQAAPFQLFNDGLQVLELTGVDEPISPGDFLEQVCPFCTAGSEADQIPVVFACEPVDCNIAGFKDRMEAIAVSLEPKQKPVKQSVYESPSSVDFRNRLEEADRLYQAGDEEEARGKYESVLADDSRDFRANVRLAQYWRRRSDRDLAGDYWNEAKKSDPNHGMIWALAGTTHLEIYLINSMYPDEEPRYEKHEIDRHRDRSITGFTRGRHLAAEAFNSSLEQHCTYSLVICHSLRKRPEDLQVADGMIRQFGTWPPQTLQLSVLQALAETFYYTVAGGSDFTAAEEALKGAESLLEGISRTASPVGTTGGQRRDAMMQADDFELLVGIAKFRLQIAKQRARRASANSNIQH